MTRDEIVNRVRREIGDTDNKVWSNHELGSFVDKAAEEFCRDTKAYHSVFNISPEYSGRYKYPKDCVTINVGWNKDERLIQKDCSHELASIRRDYNYLKGIPDTVYDDMDSKPYYRLSPIPNDYQDTRFFDFIPNYYGVLRTNVLTEPNGESTFDVSSESYGKTIINGWVKVATINVPEAHYGDVCTVKYQDDYAGRQVKFTTNGTFPQAEPTAEDRLGVVNAGETIDLWLKDPLTSVECQINNYSDNQYHTVRDITRIPNASEKDIIHFSGSAGLHTTYNIDVTGGNSFTKDVNSGAFSERIGYIGATGTPNIEIQYKIDYTGGYKYIGKYGNQEGIRGTPERHSQARLIGSWQNTYTFPVQIFYNGESFHGAAPQTFLRTQVELRDDGMLYWVDINKSVYENDRELFPEMQEYQNQYHNVIWTSSNGRGTNRFIQPNEIIDLYVIGNNVSASGDCYVKNAYLRLTTEIPITHSMTFNHFKTLYGHILATWEKVYNFYGVCLPPKYGVIHNSKQFNFVGDFMYTRLAEIEEIKDYLALVYYASYVAYTEDSDFADASKAQFFLNLYHGRLALFNNVKKKCTGVSKRGNFF